MNQSIAVKLDICKNHVKEAKRILNELCPEDISAAGGLAASEESLKYAKSQLDNVLMIISNIAK